MKFKHSASATILSTISSLLVSSFMMGMGVTTLAQQNPAGLALPDTAKVSDLFTPLLPDDLRFNGGMLGARYEANAKNRMLVVDENDMLDCFERRNVPHQDWQGEHVGKYLHAASLTWLNNHDPALKNKLDRVVTRLLKTQEPDGYLGTYPASKRWTSWDVWCHKYALIGLLTYYQANRQTLGKNTLPPLASDALAACRKMGDLLARTFGDGQGQKDINRAGEHVGMAPDSVLEAIVLLYRATNEPRYKQFAEYIVSHYDAPGGPAILASLEKTGSVRKVANAKAYEMTSNFNGILELYRVTGNKRYLTLMEAAWKDIVQNRLYITGSGSSYEVWQDDNHLPNEQKFNICETCVTVTWEQMNLELLRLTGEARFVDQLERTVYNHLLGAQKPTGDDWAYYTPLDGHKPYDKFTTCCHSSGPRGIALLPGFTMMISSDGGIVVNLYNDGKATVPLPSGNVTVIQQTRYPLDGKVTLAIEPTKSGQRFPLRLRLPGWSKLEYLKVNGKSVRVEPVNGASYVKLDRTWKKSDKVEMKLELPTKIVKGDHGNEGKAALLYGPLVLTLDASLNGPALRRLELGTELPPKLALVTTDKSPSPTFTVAGHVAGQREPITLKLIPYADAGADGKSRYEVWIPLPGRGSALNSASLFSGGSMTVSRKGNVTDSICDDDTGSFSVTFDNHPAEEDWFAVSLPKAVRIDTVTYAHGKTFHDGGWFDASGDKPQIQVQETPNGPWKRVATLQSYPNTTATNPAGLVAGETFSVSFPAVEAFAIRILGRPAHGDNSAQAFTSCAELQGFVKNSK